MSTKEGISKVFASKNFQKAVILNMFTWGGHSWNVNMMRRILFTYYQRSLMAGKFKDRGESDHQLTFTTTPTFLLKMIKSMSHFPNLLKRFRLTMKMIVLSFAWIGILEN